MPARDLFLDTNNKSLLTVPPEHAFDITPSDSLELDFVTRAVHIGTAGDLRVTMIGGETVTFAGMAAGTIKVGRFTRVWATGTTAGSLVGEY